MQPRISIEASEDQGERLVIQIAGELDMATAPQLTCAFKEMIASSRSKIVVLDMAALDFLDASGLRAIISIHRLVQSLHRTVTARNARGEVDTVLRVTGVADLLRLSVLDGFEDADQSGWTS